MTDWKTYRITNRSVSSSYIKFELDSSVSYRGGSERHIYCVNRSPFNDCYAGDNLEIDLDDTRYENSGHDFTSSSVRVANSTSMALVRAHEQNSSLQNQNAFLQSERGSLQVRNASLETENSNLRGAISNLSVEMNNKNNQVHRIQDSLTTTQNQLTTAQVQLRDKEGQLTITTEQLNELRNLFNNLQIESNNKDNDLRQKEEELARREEKIRDLKGMLGRSQEEIVRHKLEKKEARLDDLIQQLGIVRARVRTLRNAYQDLNRARENYNQANINTAENIIEQVKDELLDGGVSVENMQKICRKTEKLAKLRVEQDKLYQQQFQANIGTPPTHPF